MLNSSRLLNRERELIEIEGKIFSRDLMEHPGNPTLEQGPDVLYAVGVDLSLFGFLNVCLPMIDGPMDKLGAIKPEISTKFVGLEGSGDRPCNHTLW